MGPRSPNGLEQQQQAEATWKRRYEEAPMALGPLLAINVSDVIEQGKCLKREMAGLYPDVDDRICENYGILLAMASEVREKKTITFLTGCQIKSIVDFQDKKNINSAMYKIDMFNIWPMYDV